MGDPTTHVQGRRTRFLVVDDNEDAAFMLAECLRVSGHEVRAVYDSRRAIEQAREFGPDAVLLDIGMPFIDGYEVASLLRSDERFDRCLIVAVSGYSDEASRRRGIAAGFDHHLVKPADVDEILSVCGSPHAGAPSPGDGGSGIPPDLRSAATSRGSVRPTPPGPDPPRPRRGFFASSREAVGLRRAPASRAGRRSSRSFERSVDGR